LAISEAAYNATIPGASLANISAALDTYYRMVMLAYPNQTEYQTLYWSMNGYLAPPTSVGRGSPQSPYMATGSEASWKPGYTAGDWVDQGVTWHIQLRATVTSRSTHL
jgi:hypothetical protein